MRLGNSLGGAKSVLSALVSSGPLRPRRGAIVAVLVTKVLLPQQNRNRLRKVISQSRLTPLGGVNPFHAKGCLDLQIRKDVCGRVGNDNPLGGVGNESRKPPQELSAARYVVCCAKIAAKTSSI